jgi:hypothetical protein
MIRSLRTFLAFRRRRVRLARARERATGDYLAGCAFLGVVVRSGVRDDGAVRDLVRAVRVVQRSARLSGSAGMRLYADSLTALVAQARQVHAEIEIARALAGPEVRS